MSGSKKLLFKGLHSLVDAIEHHHKVVEPPPVAPPDEYELQTQEIRKLAESGQLVSDKIGIGTYPIMFRNSFISDSIRHLYVKWNMQVDWIYNQYRICKNARLLGFKTEFLSDIKNYASNLRTEDEEITEFFRQFDESEYKDWALAGKPQKLGKTTYWMLVPKEILQLTNSFKVLNWSMLE